MSDEPKKVSIVNMLKDLPSEAIVSFYKSEDGSLNVHVRCGRYGERIVLGEVTDRKIATAIHFALAKVDFDEKVVETGK